jgi:hypothetical protein
MARRMAIPFKGLRFFLARLFFAAEERLPGVRAPEDPPNNFIKMAPFRRTEREFWPKKAQTTPITI